MNSRLGVFFSLTLIGLGLGLGGYVANQEGHLKFLRTAHYVSLLMVVTGSIITWIAMTWMSQPDKFEVRPKQWIAFVFTLLMAVFWWGRYVFIVADTAETDPK
jgi:hypothetical protein